MSESTEAQAQAYARHSWPVFPCLPGDKIPAIPAAHPKGDPARGICEGECGQDGHGFYDATTDPDKISWWWSKEPGRNVGIATGFPGPDVLDIDNHGEAGNGFGGFRALRQAGMVPEPTAIVETPHGGLHLFFKGTDQRNGAVAKAHIDYRSAGGYVVAPPSEVDGKPYVVVRHQPVSNEFDWSSAREFLDPQKEKPQRQLRKVGPESGEIDHLAEFVSRQEHGNRNRGLFWAAARAAHHGVLDADGVEVLVDAAMRAGLGGGEAEARKTISSALRNAGREAAS